MKTTSVSYTLRKNLGQYQHEEMTTTVEAEEGDGSTGDTLMAEARAVCIRNSTAFKKQGSGAVAPVQQHVAAPTAQPTPALDIPRERKGVSAGKYVVYEIPYKENSRAEEAAGTAWRKTFYCPEIGTFKKVRLSRVAIPSLNEYYRASISVNDKGAVRFENGEDISPKGAISQVDDDMPDWGM